MYFDLIQEYDMTHARDFEFPLDAQVKLSTDSWMPL